MRRLAFAGLVLALAVVAGCGGPSREEYVDEVNGICARIAQDIQRGAQRYRTQPERLLEERVRAFERGVEQVKSAERPGGETAEQAERFTRALETFLARQLRPGIAEVQRAVRRRDLVAQRRAEERLRRQDISEVARRARELGVARCSTG